MPPTDCMRAREAVSARLDGELGELDAFRLDQHLAVCPACRAFAAESAGIADRLRTAALEPAPAGLFVAGRRRRVAAPVAAAAATLVVAVAAGASFFMGELVGGHATTHTIRTATAADTRLDPGLVAMLHTTPLPHVIAGKVIAL